MVKKPRYIVDQVDEHGGVVRSDTFKTQREMVASFPETFTPSTIREHLRSKPRIRTGERALLPKYKTHRIRRYELN